MPSPPPAAFQRRRELNVERLNRADRVIAMSHRVAEIYARLGVEPDAARTIHLTLAHIERLTPRRSRRRRRPPAHLRHAGGVRVGGQGRLLLIEAMRLLGDARRADAFACSSSASRPALPRRGGERARGSRSGSSSGRAELDSILDDVDVGLMPSIWEEAYGYAGIEFLAKGIPSSRTRSAACRTTPATARRAG